jgi:hypothetical protein
MARWAVRGPYRVEFKFGAGTSTDYSCEVKTVSIKEGGRDVSTVVPACGTQSKSVGPPDDALELVIAHDLGTASLFSLLEDHEGEAATVSVWPDLTDAPTVVYDHAVTVVHASPDELDATKEKTAKVSLPVVSVTRGTRTAPTTP